MSRLVAALLIVLATVASFGAIQAHAAPAPVLPGETVLVDLDDGTVSVVPARGAARLVAEDLKSPSGAAALADGSMLIAETGANRIMGVGGRFGDLHPVVEGIGAPQSIAVGGDGAVYVALPLKGEVGRVDLAAGRYSPLATGLQLPAGLTERDGTLYVSEAAPAANDVVRIDRTGTRSVFATGFGQPAGLATGPGDTVLVADTKAGTIVRLDGAGRPTELARLRDPKQLSTNPFHPGPDQEFTFSVAAAEGMVRFDTTAKRISTVPANGIAAVATVPGGEVPLPPLATTTLVPTTVASTIPTTVPTSAPPSTRVGRTTVAALPEVSVDTGPTTSTYALGVSLAILAVVAIAVITALVVRRPRGMADSGFEERPLDADSVVDAFGPCAAQEVELAEAEGGLRAVVVQRDTAKVRATELEEEASRTTFEHLRARAELEDAVQRREARAAGGRPEPLPEFRQEDLGLATDQGHAALATFVRAEITADELEARWLALGEHAAIEYTRLVGVARASGGRVSVAELRAAQREQQAKAAADLAEADHEHALLEISRLAEREQQAMARIVEARQRLASCRDGRPLLPPPPSSPVDRTTAGFDGDGDGRVGPQASVADRAPDLADDPATATATATLASSVVGPLAGGGSGPASSLDPAVDAAAPAGEDSPAVASDAGDERAHGSAADLGPIPEGATVTAADGPEPAAAERTIDVRDPDPELTPLVLVQRAREAARRRADRTGEQPPVSSGAAPTTVATTRTVDRPVDQPRADGAPPWLTPTTPEPLTTPEPATTPATTSTTTTAPTTAPGSTAPPSTTSPSAAPAAGPPPTPATPRGDDPAIDLDADPRPPLGFL